MEKAQIKHDKPKDTVRGSTIYVIDVSERETICGKTWLKFSKSLESYENNNSRITMNLR